MRSRALETLKSKKSALATLLGVAAQGALVRSPFFRDGHLLLVLFGLEKKDGQRRVDNSM